jgi:actin-related protein
LDPQNINPAIKRDKQDYALPDGTTIMIDNESMYLSPEVLFQPSMLGYNIRSIPEAVLTSLRNINNEYWALLLSNIVISGGNSSYSGYVERLKAEIIRLLPQLGPIPTIKQAPQIQEEKQLVSKETSQKTQDTCEKCGNLVDLSTGIKFCPFCGNPMDASSIDIGIGLGDKGQAHRIDKGKCPICKKHLPGDSDSLFCPFCGGNLQASSIPEAPEAPQTKTEEYLEKTPFLPQYYDNAAELIKLFIPDNTQYAIFSGGSILASLNSFRSLFVDYNQFITNPNLLYRDISELF